MNKNNLLTPFIVLFFFGLFITACSKANNQTPVLLPTYTPGPTNTKLPNILPPTWTPGSEIKGSTVTPTPNATWTPLATETPLFTIPPSPTPYPPIQLAELGNMPKIFGNFYFLKAGELIIFNGETGGITPLAIGDNAESISGITNYKLSENGIRVLLTIVKKSGEMELIVVDLKQSKILIRLGLSVKKLIDIQLSPKGDYFSYTYIPFENIGVDKDGFSLIRIASVNSPGKIYQLAECDRGCTNTVWTPDNLYLLWNDGEGLWRGKIPSISLFYNLDEETNFNSPAVTLTPSPAIATPQNIDNPTSQGSDSNLVEKLFSASDKNTSQAIEFPGLSKILSISPFGNYLIGIAQNQPDEWLLLSLGERWYETIPGRFLFVDRYLTIDWTSTEQLTIARAGLPGISPLPPSLEIYSLNKKEGESIFDNFIKIDLGKEPREVPFAPIQLSDDLYGLAILDFNSPTFKEINGVYIINLKGEMKKVNDLPFVRVVDSMWAPDGTALVLFSPLSILYTPLDGGTIFDLRSALGREACCYQWKP